MERKEAMEQGLKTYENGKPCGFGHLGPRYSKSGNCVRCMELRHEDETRRRQEAKGMDLISGLERAAGNTTGVWSALPDNAAQVIAAIQKAGGVVNGVRNPLRFVAEWTPRNTPEEWDRTEFEVPLDQDCMHTILTAADEMCELRGGSLSTWVVGPGGAADTVIVGMVIHPDDVEPLQERIATL